MIQSKIIHIESKKLSHWRQGECQTIEIIQIKKKKTKTKNKKQTNKQKQQDASKYKETL